MKRKILDIFIIIIILFILYQVIIKKTIVYSSINYALNIWINNLIPTLFPFFVISDILINYNFTYYIPKFIIKCGKKLFNITDNMITILLLSIISGFPSNARNTRLLYDNNLISLDEANHILIFSHFANPLFVLNTVGIYFFHNGTVGIILLISHYISNFILGLLFRKYFNHANISLKDSNKNSNFGNIFVSAIKKAVDTTLLICGIITIFFLLAELINNIFYFNSYNSTIIKGILEITIGIESLCKLNLSLTFKAVIASCILSFGGFSVHMQVMSQIADSKIKYKYFFIGRIYQMILSGFITFIICTIIKVH